MCTTCQYYDSILNQNDICVEYDVDDDSRPPGQDGMFVSRAQWLLTAPGTPGCFGDFARAGFDVQFQRMAAEKATLYDSGGDPYSAEWLPLYDITAIRRQIQPALSDGAGSVCLLNTCREGHTGLLCAECQAGFAKRLSTDVCFRCEGTDVKMWFLPPVMYTVIAFILTYKAVHVESLKSSQTTILIFFFQTATLVSSGTGWFGQKDKINPKFLEWMTAIKLYMNLELDQTRSCPLGVYGRFYYDVIYVPFCLVVGAQVAFALWHLIATSGVPAPVWRVVKKLTCGHLGETLAHEHIWSPATDYQRIRSYCMLFNFMYAPITRKSAQFFFCRHDMSEDRSYLIADLAEGCDTTTYYVTLAVATVVFTVVGFVVPAGISYLLYKHPNRWHKYDEKSHLRRGARVQLRRLRVSFRRRGMMHRMVGAGKKSNWKKTDGRELLSANPVMGPMYLGAFLREIATVDDASWAVVLQDLEFQIHGDQQWLSLEPAAASSMDLLARATHGSVDVASAALVASLQRALLKAWHPEEAEAIGALCGGEGTIVAYNADATKYQIEVAAEEGSIEVARYWFSTGDIVPRGTDVNEAGEAALSAALREPYATGDGASEMAAELFAAAQQRPFQGADDAMYRCPGFARRHVEMLASAEPPICFETPPPPAAGASYRPKVADLYSLKEQHKRKNAGAAARVVAAANYDRQIEYDPLSGFYAFCVQTHGWFWFEFQLVQKMVINIAYLRGVDSEDGWPWKQFVVVFLAFFCLLQTFEQPYRDRSDNLISMFAAICIILILQVGMAQDKACQAWQTSFFGALFVFLIVLSMILLWLVFKLMGKKKKGERKEIAKHARGRWGSIADTHRAKGLAATIQAADRSPAALLAKLSRHSAGGAAHDVGPTSHATHPEDAALKQAAGHAMAGEWLLVLTRDDGEEAGGGEAPPASAGGGQEATYRLQMSTAAASERYDLRGTLLPLAGPGAVAHNGGAEGAVAGAVSGNSAVLKASRAFRAPHGLCGPTKDAPHSLRGPTKDGAARKVEWHALAEHPAGGEGLLGAAVRRARPARTTMHFFKNVSKSRCGK
jgi:hypothetical protein